METLILDGKQIAEEMRAEMTAEVKRLKAEHGLVPGLAVVLVGENPASISYVTAKQKAAEEMGIHSEEHRRSADFAEEELLKLVDQLNNDPKIHGILVQLPLPKHIDETKVLYKIDPDKDVDGFHPVNLGKLMIGEPAFLPCTPHGVQQILVRSGFNPDGKHVVIVGRSNIVGKPVANILLQKKPGANATVTICHTGTKDLAQYTCQADILIVAAGRPNTVNGDMVREGVVVIDVGVNRIEDASRPRGFRLVGDVDFESVKPKARAITPVPGGVGPMTITMLLYNTIESAKMRLSA
ncbi:MAG: bifunctional methylenetetrahydrofolate dehydrogenase/methenyltetrahydrofolate cyclohydrolase FolD [Armatimonadetes bacterium]|nr:bifunctional methylenetetrahydrofolate dehydrogenase/methenyltetrahydrofolate cyclohydrolase FolD [Armatimonadota bacterium]